MDEISRDDNSFLSSQYGFLRVSSGIDNGAFYHELFLGGRPDLAKSMQRVGVPKGVDRRLKHFRSTDGQDPDFYAMQPVYVGFANEGDFWF